MLNMMNLTRVHHIRPAELIRGHFYALFLDTFSVLLHMNRECKPNIYNKILTFTEKSIKVKTELEVT